MVSHYTLNIFVCHDALKVVVWPHVRDSAVHRADFWAVYHSEMAALTSKVCCLPIVSVLINILCHIHHKFELSSNI